MSSSRISRDRIEAAVTAAVPGLDAVTLARAVGAAARAVIGATDTGQWHGPVEGFISDGRFAGMGITLSPNGIHSWASERVYRRAREQRDIGTIRALAREYDRAGARSCAERARDLAGIFADSAAIDAYVSCKSITSGTNPRGFVGPAVGVAYHAPTDMYVEVIARDGDAVVFRSPYRFDDRCAPAFLRDVLTGGNIVLADYVYGRKSDHVIPV